MNDPFSDPFDDAPVGRRSHLFNGLKGLVSDSHIDHMRRVGGQVAETAKSVGGDVFDSAVDWAADNPDKMENIGGKLGAAAGASAGSPMIGGRAGAKAGRKLGGFLSKKAQEKKGTSSEPSEPAFDPNDPFA